ncbi:MAG: NAD-dependent epimerase/dehydratase family protein [Patescibacteria group bacterium]|jgi:UDP-sulfoquinovose synthase (EC 3.13.1.1)|nr:NAD-dependent epimerase/dehydratase family protein [Patescibacteria group bacterium]
MKIIVFGGDGFCGWPTSLHLSSKGHQVLIIDNFSRRKIDIDLGTNSLTPIQNMSRRLETWRKLTGNKIEFENIDIARDFDKLVNIFLKFKPDGVVHFAEQRAAPYSMKNSTTKRYTVDNNVNATNNILCAIVECKLDIHLVHLGTMGVYGYGWMDDNPIPEGYVEVTIDTKNGKLKKEILHPVNPGSIYHMTKTLDQLMFGYYAKNNLIRVTDLHQGVVWGTQTAETKLDQNLINRFDYDGDYGTVLNRFLMQVAINHPLTIYGTGGQTRAFIHISDTVKCIEIAINNPPKKGDRPLIFNQVTETRRVSELALLVSKKTGAKIEYLKNPRKEASENELVVENKKFLKLGLNPTTLSEGLLDEVTEIARKYVDRVDEKTILPRSKW